MSKLLWWLDRPRITPHQFESHPNVEPGVKEAPGEVFQFERVGYFVADRIDSNIVRPVFNRIATLRDSWSR